MGLLVPATGICSNMLMKYLTNKTHSCTVCCLVFYNIYFLNVRGKLYHLQAGTLISSNF